MSALPVILRAKRAHQTVFIVARPADTVRSLKSVISEANRVPPERIRIIDKDKVTVYEDESTVADHMLEDNAIVYFVYKAESSDAYEEIKVQNLDVIIASHPETHAAADKK